MIYKIRKNHKDFHGDKKERVCDSVGHSKVLFCLLSRGLKLRPLSFFELNSNFRNK